MSLRIAFRISPVIVTAILLSIVFISAWKTARQPSRRIITAASGSLLYNLDHPPQCKERNLLCCQGIDNPRRPLVKDLLSIMNVTVSGPAPTGNPSLSGLVGVQCNSANMFGMTVNGQCGGRVVCCDDLFNNGKIAMGCDVVDVGI
ncbi:hypothetical protein CPB83DRAFT_853384 [Crepidotus variabilis]|uniref:Hydrophobin n=1 Tax=Crepidotus variabilis TaxID=179855 RepID=A0A9P6EGX7_9AGAR|nr:hypothetical protein CPB83DRAFT_853384 [Crepidotus variabilis]